MRKKRFYMNVANGDVVFATSRFQAYKEFKKQYELSNKILKFKYVMSQKRAEKYFVDYVEQIRVMARRGY